MKQITTTGDAGGPLTTQMRDILPYDPNPVLADVKGYGDLARMLAGPQRKDIMNSFTTFMIIPSFFTILLGFMMGAVLSQRIGLENPWPLVAATTFASWAILGFLFCVEVPENHVKNVLAGAGVRIRKMTEECDDPLNLGAMRAARAMADDHLDLRHREAIIALDAVGLGLEDALRKAGPDRDMAARARRSAECAIVSIMAPIDVEGSAEAAIASTLRLEGICSIAPRGSLDVPEVVRSNVELANRALAEHPDMTDACGNSIADLLRTHVPRLLDVRAEAMRTADEQAKPIVEATFMKAFDGVAESIREGMVGIHAKAMDDLVDQVRFMQSNRPTDVLDVAV
jgi:hypothetical protein